MNSWLRWRTQYPQTQGIHLLFSYQQLQWCKWLFELKIIPAFISDCGNSFNCKLKKLINDQIVTFYSPSNALCLSDESARIQHFKHQTFIGMCSPFTWFNLQIMNISVYEDTSSLKQVECVIVKTRCFYGLPLIHNQIWKNSVHYSWRFMVKLHTSDIRMTYEYIWVTYGWHTSTYEWHTDDIRVHTNDIRMACKYIRVTYKWHANDIRMT